MCHNLSIEKTDVQQLLITINKYNVSCSNARQIPAPSCPERRNPQESGRGRVSDGIHLADSSHPQ
jgi:hypothetical protein